MLLSLPDAASLSGVGNYTQSQTGQLCIPSSITNSFFYYRNTRGKTYLWANNTPISTVASSIASCMGGSVTSNSNIPTAVSTYAVSRGYSVTCNNIWSPSYFDYKFEIYYGDCPLIGFASVEYGGGHMTTGVSYFLDVDNDQAIGVYDNHSSTLQEYKFSTTENDFVATIFFN